MSSRRHLRLAIVALVVWALFLLVGWPDYYQQYATRTMVVFDLVLLPPIAWACWRALRRVRVERRMCVALWIALHFTLPLAVYDALYCGMVLGHGWAFLSRYWYLTVYYFIPWMLLPGVAWLQNRGSR